MGALCCAENGVILKNKKRKEIKTEKGGLRVDVDDRSGC